MDIRKAGRQLAMAFLAVLLFLAAAPSFSYANSPAPARSINIWVEEMPEEGVYVELLIPIGEDDEAYTDYNEKAEQARGLTEASEIVSYRDEDGYVSYLAHMRGAVVLQRESSSDHRMIVCSFGDGAREGRYTHLEYMQEHFGTVKAAILDRDGRVLTVSDETRIRPEKSRTGRDREYLAYSMSYYPATGKLSASFVDSGIGNFDIFIYAFILFLMIIYASFTGLVESGIAWLFRIGPLRKIVLVNFVSNLIFNSILIVSEILEAGSAFGMTYVTRVLIGEFLVMVSEYRVYRWMFPGERRSKLFVFTVVANLVSLAGGRILLFLGNGIPLIL